MAGVDNLKPWPKGVSGNPAGRPPGSPSLSTHIQNMLNDPDFELLLEDRREGFKRFEGVPAKAIITTAVRKAAAGDTRWADWLAKYGYGQKVDITSNEQQLGIIGYVLPKPEEKE